MNEANDQNDVVLANLPPSRLERRLAFVVGAVLLGIGVLVVPFGKVQLPMFNAWPAIPDVFNFIADLITWFLLISQFKIVRSRALLVLASGYLFAGVIRVPHLLTFPGAFTATGLLGAGLQSSVWLGLFARVGYPLAIIFYAEMKRGPEAPVLHGSTRTAVAASIAVVIALVLTMTWIATVGEPYLPKLFLDRYQTTVNLQYVAALLSLLSVAALLLLLLRVRSVLDLWLMVAMCAWLAQYIASWTNTTGRLSLSFFAGSTLSVISSTVLLFLLLKEAMNLYGRLAVSLVTLRRLSAEKLLRSEAYLAEAQRLSHTGSWARAAATDEMSHWSEECYRVMGFEPHDGPPRFETFLQRVHPDDQAKVREVAELARREKVEYELDYRLVHPGGDIRDIHVVGHPVLGPSGDLVEFVGTVIDVTERKLAEAKIRQSEMELRQILDFTPQQVAVLGPDNSRLYVNQATLDYFGFTLEEWQSGGGDPGRFVHPEDRERFRNEAPSKFLRGLPHETEMRSLGKDGTYRWFLFRWNPLRDEQGRLIRWYVAATDIEDRKQAEQRLQNENVALREEIDRASMFEEVVGSSPALHTVLSRVSKVAPTDSTVLITGETGTGKELIARAVHRRSRRSSRAFVSVNCAAIPPDLIASELFGHEKGAFTGATQRRSGRFELAEGGTIFLDEIGELPAGTQIALLRVLQEHEFERVGGTGSIRTDVRVIAATNRDLQAAIAAGTFRSDLFYRLNVFPIEVPPLRERREDIPVLVEYFIDRFTRKAGKTIRGINKKSLELLQSYPWPGNIRELQNIIERSVVVCETENFSVDESWLSRHPRATEPSRGHGFFKKFPSEEKSIIEAALSESGGQVYGPSGAASMLGIPRSTLESKIRTLKINKNRFKSTDPSKNS